MSSEEPRPLELETTNPAERAPRKVAREAHPVLIWPGKKTPSERELVHAADRAGNERFLTVFDPGSNVDAPSSLILGDNAKAMKALLNESSSLAGSVRLCYLDPPYNTGETFSTYHDSRPVDDWLNALSERLTLVRSLLRADGSVWLHLDDNHQHHGRMLLDEVFGPHAFVATVIWQKRTTRDSRRAFSQSHDYIHVYSPLGNKGWKQVRNGLPDSGEFKNPDGDPRGSWRSVPMSAQAGHATRAQFYDVVTPTGEVHSPPPGRCWSYSKERLAELDADGRVYWPRKGAGRPRLKRYESESSDLAPLTIWDSGFAGDTSVAKKELLASFPGESRFDTPKPELLLRRILEIGSNPGDLVLDPYLGSGTTGVVAAQTARRFIGIESSETVLRDVAVPRLEASLARGTFSIFKA